jgi:hypothetical protein
MICDVPREVAVCPTCESELKALYVAQVDVVGVECQADRIGQQHDYGNRGPWGSVYAPVREWVLKQLGNTQTCEAIGPHHGDRCSGGRIQSPNAAFTRDCYECGGTGLKKQ